MPSFDIVSTLDPQEIDNALNQAQKEIAQRYDFRTAQASLAWSADRKSVEIQANAEDRVQAASEAFQAKLVKRGISLNGVTLGAIEAVGGQMRKQVITFQQGIPVEKGKEIAKLIKESKLKVQAAIQGEQVRITGKVRDDLQSAIALIRGAGLEIDLQFTNFRD